MVFAEKIAIFFRPKMPSHDQSIGLSSLNQTQSCPKMAEFGRILPNQGRIWSNLLKKIKFEIQI